MYRLQCVTVCFLAYYVIGAIASVSFITPCKPKDTACQKASAIAALSHFVAGVPELGIPAADPIIIDDVRSDDNNLKLGFRNMKVAGIKNCKILDFSRNPDESTMSISAECPIVATGQYDLNGKLLFIPAEGDGDFSITIDTLKIFATIKVKVVEKAGAKHWKITGFDYNYDIIGKASIKLENLYGGDEARAKPIQEVLNHSPTEIIKDVGSPIIKQILTKEVEIVQKFFKAVPISDLEL